MRGRSTGSVGIGCGIGDDELTQSSESDTESFTELFPFKVVWLCIVEGPANEVKPPVSSPLSLREESRR